MEKKRPVAPKKVPSKVAPKTAGTSVKRGSRKTVVSPARSMGPGRRVAVFFAQDGDGPFVLLHDTGIPTEDLGASSLPLTLGAGGEATRSLVRVETLVQWYRGRIFTECRVRGNTEAKPGDPLAEWQGNLRFFENLLAHHPPRKRETTN